MDKLPKDMDIQEKVDMADSFCKSIIDPIFTKQCDFISEYMNCYEQKMNWDREVISEEAIWLVKKNYFMNVWDSEGVRFKGSPSFKMKGVEAVKASFPQYSRDALKKCYKASLKLDEVEVQRIIEETRDEFYSYDVNSIAIPTRVNGIDKYYCPEGRFVSGAQAHVKAAINHNLLLDELELKSVSKINDGDSIRWLPLKKPNPYNIKEIGFDTNIPKEFGLEEYVDKEALFEKGFLSPMRRVLGVMSWNEEETITLF